MGCRLWGRTESDTTYVTSQLSCKLVLFTRNTHPFQVAAFQVLGARAWLVGTTLDGVSSQPHPSPSSPQAPTGAGLLFCVPQRYAEVLGAVPHASDCGLTGTRGLCGFGRVRRKAHWLRLGPESCD